MQTRSIRLKALVLAFLLVGGSLGLPALDLVVWHLGGSHHASIGRPTDTGTGSDHDRQCVFTHQMPSSRPATAPADGLILSALGTTPPSQQPTPRLISAEVQRANPPRGPPSFIV